MGTLAFSYLTVAAFKGPKPAEQQNGIKNEHSDSILMRDLIWAFCNSKDYSSKKTLRSIKNVKLKAAKIFPLTTLCYAQTMTKKYENHTNLPSLEWKSLSNYI